MRLTPHFAVSEWTCRDGTPYPAEWIDERLRPLAQLLEAIRADCDDWPVTIESGYRTPTHNRRVKGARNSQHVQGRAADIIIEGFLARTVQQRILALRDTNATVRSLLGGLGCYPGFTHVDTRPGARLVRWNR